MHSPRNAGVAENFDTTPRKEDPKDKDRQKFRKNKKNEKKDFYLPPELSNGIAHPYFREMYLKFSRLQNDEQAPEKLKTALLNDVNAWSLCCALMLTISIPATISIQEDNFHVDPNIPDEVNDVVKYIFIIFTCISTCCSIVAIRICIITYVTLSGVPDELVGPYMISKFGKFSGGWFNFDIAHYSVWVDWSIYMLLLGFTAGIFLTFGYGAAIASLVVSLITIFFYKKSADAVGAIVGQMTTFEKAVEMYADGKSVD